MGPPTLLFCAKPVPTDRMAIVAVPTEDGGDATAPPPVTELAEGIWIGKSGSGKTDQKVALTCDGKISVRPHGTLATVNLSARTDREDRHCERPADLVHALVSPDPVRQSQPFCPSVISTTTTKEN